MVMGELDYAGFRSQANELQADMGDITLIIFVIFCVTMSLVVNNLLVSRWKHDPEPKL